MKPHHDILLLIIATALMITAFILLSGGKEINTVNAEIHKKIQHERGW